MCAWVVLKAQRDKAVEKIMYNFSAGGVGVRGCGLEKPAHVYVSRAGAFLDRQQREDPVGVTLFLRADRCCSTRLVYGVVGWGGT